MIKNGNILLLLFCAFFITQNTIAEDRLSHWVDSVQQQLSLSEKLGQTVWLELNTFPDEVQKSKITDYVRKGEIGGIIFESGNEWEILQFIRNLKRVSNYPVKFYGTYQNFTSTKISSDANLMDQKYLQSAPPESIRSYAKVISELSLRQGLDGFIFDKKC